MMSLEEMKDRLAEMNPEAVLFDGMDDAIIGIASRCGMSPVVAYSYEKAIQVFEGKGMTHDEAVEWFEFNVASTWVGDGSPVCVEYLNGE